LPACTETDGPWPADSLEAARSVGAVRSFALLLSRCDRSAKICSSGCELKTRDLPGKILAAASVFLS
jgi:hypothetical protein